MGSPPPMSMVSMVPIWSASPPSSSAIWFQCCALSTPLPRCACRPTTRASSARAADRNSSSFTSGRPNLDVLPPVFTLSWWPSPRPRSTRSHRRRPRNTSGQCCSASTLSSVTLMPRSRAKAYSSRGAKLGVNSTRSIGSEGATSNTRSSSPRETHSRPKPSSTSVRRMSGCELALIAKKRRSTAAMPASARARARTTSRL